MLSHMLRGGVQLLQSFRGNPHLLGIGSEKLVTRHFGRISSNGFILSLVASNGLLLLKPGLEFFWSLDEKLSSHCAMIGTAEFSTDYRVLTHFIGREAQLRVTSWNRVLLEAKLW